MAIRIAHFTDVHITEDPKRMPMAALLSMRLPGWGNLRFLGRFRAFQHARTVARAFLRDLEQVNPDAVVFTGDMTGLALDSEFEAARVCMAPILDDSRVLGIPGNHDVYVHAAERRGLFEQCFGPWLRSDLDADVFPSAHRRTYPYPLVRLLGDEVAVVAVKDARATWPFDASGRVPAEQLAALEAVLELPQLADRVVILAMHYCVRLRDGSRDKYLHRLSNDQEVLSLAERCGVRLIVCGHVHHRIVHPPGEVTPVAIANPGSLSHYRRERAYHVITVDDGQVSVAARRLDKATGAFAPWTSAPMAGTLPDSIQTELTEAAIPATR